MLELWTIFTIRRRCTAETGSLLGCHLSAQKTRQREHAHIRERETLSHIYYSQHNFRRGSNYENGRKNNFRNAKWCRWCSPFGVRAKWGIKNEMFVCIMDWQSGAEQTMPAKRSGELIIISYALGFVALNFLAVRQRIEEENGNKTWVLPQEMNWNEMK